MMLVSEDGELVSGVDRVVDVQSEYDGPPSSHEEHLAMSDAVVVARAISRTQRSSPAAGGQSGEPLVSAQTFATDQQLWGDRVPESFAVEVPGGVAESSSGVLLEEETQEPQFREGASYLLFLRKREDATYQLASAGYGRYRVESGAVVSWFGEEIMHGAARNEVINGGVDEYAQEEILGKQVGEIADAFAAANRG